MAKVLPRCFIALLAVVVLCNVWQPAFVPAAGNNMRASMPVSPAAAGAAAATLLSVPAAYADNIDDAAKKFSERALPLFKKLDWSANPEWAKYLTAASYDGKALAVALDRVLLQAMSMNPELITKSVEAHSHAIKNVGPDLVLQPEDMEAVSGSIARLIGSAGTGKSLAVYDSMVKAGVGGLAEEYYEKLGPDAVQAWKAFFELQQAVKPGFFP